MKTIIAGTREIKDGLQILIEQAIAESGFTISGIISGASRGIDQMAIIHANENGIPCRVFPANWERNGKSAGYRRNDEMVAKAEGLIAIWDGSSLGTAHVIQAARVKGIPVYVKNVDPLMAEN